MQFFFSNLSCFNDNYFLPLNKTKKKEKKKKSAVHKFAAGPAKRFLPDYTWWGVWGFPGYCCLRKGGWGTGLYIEIRFYQLHFSIDNISSLACCIILQKKKASVVSPGRSNSWCRVTRVRWWRCGRSWMSQKWGWMRVGWRIHRQWFLRNRRFGGNRVLKQDEVIQLFLSYKLNFQYTIDQNNRLKDSTERNRYSQM